MLTNPPSVAFEMGVSIAYRLTLAICLSFIQAAAAEFDVDSEQLRELSPRPGTVISSSNIAEFHFVLDPDLAALISQDWLTIRVGDITSSRPHQPSRQGSQQLGGPAK